uniref:Scavenger receptor n=1 Tax=Ruditapes philippinarum TaxID=129788 RepID=A0A482AYP8_RUDPH|nr:scavenger receptor [Ruditapes philippinarum]
MTIRSKPLRITLLVSAILLILISIAVLVFVLIFDRVFLKILWKNLALTPGSPVYEGWVAPSVPIYFTVHLYNLTNFDQFKNGSRPHFDIVGPFVYQEKRERFNINFLNDSSPPSVKFDHRIFYYFKPEMSVGDPNDFTITTPDLLVATTINKNMGFAVSGYERFITKTAQEVMWGYDHPFFNSVFGMFTTKQAVGLFATINGTEVFNYVINTGADNIKDIGKIYEVDGKQVMQVWEHPEANMINGTDGSLAPPGLELGSTVEFHAASICRSSTLYAVDKKPTQNHEGVEVVVFSPAPPKPDRITEWRNDMFCSKTNGCPLKGLIDLEPCLSVRAHAVPLFLSQPYFLGADPRITDKFDGIPVPDPVDHSTWVHIEPTAGLVLEAFKRIQFNLKMKLDYGSEETYYMPTGWVAETAIADKKTLDTVYNKMFLPRKRIPFFLSIAGAVAALLSVILILVLVFCVRTRSTSHRAKRDGTISPTSAKMDRTFPVSSWSDPPPTTDPQV